MGAFPVLRRFTPEEYLQLERASTTRNEYLDGLIYAMAGGTGNHDDLAVNTLTLIKNQLRGGKCKVHSSDFRIALSATGPYFYPDLSVFCGKIQYLDDTSDCALNPVAVVEVLSKSTRKYDRETKLPRYQQMPSLRHIVLISQFAVSVEHFFRTPGGKWKSEHLNDRGSTFDLLAVGAQLPLAGIYEGLSLRTKG